ncbi:MAG: hypothetical protein COA38_01885 [Fluviicola sp.]|nr:MAG: hypothetical protein COA38_01885 [Fluviicola sp.]
MKLIVSVFLILTTILHASAQETYPLAPKQDSSDSSMIIEEVKSEIVDFPDVDASFPGGNHLLKSWIKTNLEYPEISRELGDQGRVYVTFVVELDGSISNTKVVQGGVTDELNREAIRIIESMAQWTSAQVKGKSIRTRCRVPVDFILGM